MPAPPARSTGRGTACRNGLDPAALARLVVGDLGGVLLRRPNLDPRDASKVDVLNQMWTGIQHAHLASIARRAHEYRAPGVIVMAMGASRKSVICEALAEGLCSELVIDQDLAAALRDEIAGRFGAARATLKVSSTRDRPR